MTAVVRLPGGADVRGQVRMIAPTVDPQTRNAIVYVDLPAADSSPARAGMFARGEFELGRASALSLPQTAVVQRDGFAYAFRVDGNNRVVADQDRRRPPGRRPHRGDRRPRADAQVVATGAGFLADGDAVRVVAARSASRPAEAAPADERLLLVDPQPDPGDPAVPAADARRRDGLPRR